MSEPSLGTSLSLSGAAITTEGFLAPKGGSQTTLYIIEGIIGLGIVGLFITFLPTAYSIYSQREEQVTRVAFRFGAPPSGVQVLAQVYRLGLTEELDELWRTWEEWFTTMAETHITNSGVIFYHSSQPGTSWITTAGAILDACALFSSTVDHQDGPWVHLCFQAGCRTLRDIVTDVARPSIVSKLVSEHAIHVTRAEYDGCMRGLEWLWSTAQRGSRGKLARFCEFAWPIRYLPHRSGEPGLCSQSSVVLRSNARYCSSQAHETRTRMRDVAMCTRVASWK
ncbi:MAG: hypothetical protein ACXVAV_15315 [Ktedonobacteraceae bacterium]